MRLTFEGELWRWEARTEDWFFVSVPAELSADIAELATVRRGFGSLRVQVRVGQSQWRTSIFPSTGEGGQERVYVLPVKRSIREAEHLAPGLSFPVTLDVLDA